LGGVDGAPERVEADIRASVFPDNPGNGDTVLSNVFNKFRRQMKFPNISCAEDRGIYREGDIVYQCREGKPSYFESAQPYGRYASIHVRGLGSLLSLNKN
jgi:hypothetical protein